jgi:hypothetical protein
MPRRFGKRIAGMHAETLRRLAEGFAQIRRDFADKRIAFGGNPDLPVELGLHEPQLRLKPYAMGVLQVVITTGRLVNPNP